MILSKDGFINLREYEIVSEPIPPNETPRQFVLRMTGRDFPDLASGERDFTWQELKDAGVLPIIVRIIEIAYLPRVLLRKKEQSQWIKKPV